ncbi:hypothetical protein ZWY2020_000872 [Hordeum vulgare]|nr:hypothetical protein ZWY2020_000872 [Hordeum vulgare]
MDDAAAEHQRGVGNEPSFPTENLPVGFLKMPRRKRNWTEHTVGGRGAVNKAICKLYKHINEDQRAAIRDMGTGAFLDIKCGYLHNTLVTWFTRQYHSGRKGFVVPRRGFIPLTEESVHKILGIPRGDIEIKYEADYDNEDEIASSLFPGDGSRPKITTVATAIINNNNGDASFKKLWLIYIVSTVLAPTTDTRISNKCYPMLEHIDQANRLNLCKFVVAQLHEHLSKGKFTKGCLLYCMLRYLDALDCDGMELELPNTPYTINAWSKTHVDVVAEMDMLEHDPPSFGNFQFASGVDTLLTELVVGPTTATRNTTTSRIKRGTEERESDDTSSEDSAEFDNDTNEDNVDIERDKKKRVTRKCPESTKEDGEKKRKHVQQAGVNVSIKRKSTATLKQPSPKRQATRRSPRLAWITSSNVTVAVVSHAPMEQSSSRSSANKATEHVLNVIKDLSESAKRLGMFQGKKYDSTGAIPKTQAANANKRSHGSSSDKARDNRPGAFTPPSFSLGLSHILSNPRNEVNIDYEHLDAGNPLEIMPLSWAQPTVVETDLQMVEYPLSDKLTAFLATGDQDEIDADLAEELDDYERHLEDFFKKKRAAATTAGAARSNNMAGETGVQSVTPKTNPHKERVKKPSRFKLSPYDDDINVTSEEEDIYKKLMLSSKYKKNGNSSIKK